MTARRPGRPPRPVALWVRRTAALLAVVGLATALAGMVGGTPAAAATDTVAGTTVPGTTTSRTTSTGPTTRGTASSGAASSTTAAATLGVQLTSVSPQVLSAGADLTVVVTITNDGADTVSTGTVGLSLSRFRISSSSDLESWLTQDSVSASTLTTTPLPGPLAPGASVAVTLTAPASTIRLSNVWGPRGMVVDVDADHGRSGELRSFLLWQSTETLPHAEVALLAPVVGGAGQVALDDLTGTASATPSPTSTPAVVSPGSRLDALLTAARVVPELGLAVDPALLPTAGDQSAAPWQTELTTLLADGRDAIALPWADPDVSALGAGSATALLGQARSLSATAAPDLSTDLVWADDPVDAAAAAVVRGSGATRLIVPQQDDGRIATLSTSAGDLDVLVPDSQLSALVTGSTGTVAEVTQEALARLAVDARDDGSDRVLIAAPRDWQADPERLAAVVAALRAAPWVTVTTSADLVTGSLTAKVTAAETSAPDGAMPADQVRGLAAADADLGTFSQVAASPTVVTSGVSQAVLATLAYAWRSSPDRRDAAVAQVLTSIAARRDGVVLVPRADLTMISQVNSVRFTVRNDLPVPVDVGMTVLPAKACLGSTTAAPVTVPARSEAAITTTLVAHANCTVDVEAWLVAADGTRVSTQPLRFAASLSPRVENVGTAVAGVVLGLGLMLGLVRTVRRGQSSRRGRRASVVPEQPVRLGVLGGGESPEPDQALDPDDGDATDRTVALDAPGPGPWTPPGGAPQDDLRQGPR